MTTDTPDVLALREARERLGLTLRDAAPRLGIDFTYLSKVENGHERPSDALLLRMCDLYGLEPDAVVLARAVAEVPPAVRDALIAAVRAEAWADFDTLGKANVNYLTGLADGRAETPVPSTDVLALREALLDDMAAMGWGHREAVRKRLDALIAAVRAETLAGSGVVVDTLCVCGHDQTYHTGDPRFAPLCWPHDWPDSSCVCLEFIAATPPTPALTAARLAPAVRVALNLTGPLADQGAMHHAERILAALATPPAPGEVEP